MITQPEKGRSIAEGAPGLRSQRGEALGAASAPHLPAGGGGCALNVAGPSCELLT